MADSPFKLVTVDPKANAKAEVVKMAKRALEMAEAGELVDFAYFGVCPDGAVRTGFTATEDQHRRLSACSRMLWRFHQTLDDNTETTT